MSGNDVTGARLATEPEARASAAHDSVELLVVAGRRLWPGQPLVQRLDVLLLGAFVGAGWWMLGLDEGDRATLAELRRRWRPRPSSSAAPA